MIPEWWKNITAFSQYSGAYSRSEKEEKNRYMLPGKYLGYDDREVDRDDDKPVS